MYLEIIKPPTIIVTPKISDATLAFGAFGAFGLGVGVGLLSKGITLFVFVLAIIYARVFTKFHFVCG